MIPGNRKGFARQFLEKDFQFLFHRFRKLRFYFTWLFVLLLAFFAMSTDPGFLLGIPAILFGEAIRIWSHGYLRKSRRLATDGPYAYVRNPLYVGNFLIGLGFCFIIWHPIVAITFMIGFLLVYWVAIKGEEERLAYKFGEAYADYARRVPRFIPRFSPYEHRANARFRIHRVWGHGEYITILATIALLLILYLRQEFYQERNPITGLTTGLLVLTIAASLSSVFAMIFRYGRKPVKTGRNLR